MNKPLARLDPAPDTGTRLGFTTAEFLRMGELGAFDDMKVELVGGEIQRMTPPMGFHGGRQASVIGQLWAAIPDPLGRVFGEVAVDLGGDTVLGCDAAVTAASVLEQRPLLPAETLLVVEAVGTTRRRDLEEKRPLYAAAGIPNYWVVDGPNGVTHVFSDPADGAYRSAAEVTFDRPIPVPGTGASITL